MTEEVTFKVRVVTERDGGGWHAFCPALKGLHACGATAEEAVHNAADAATAYLMSVIKHGEPIPLGVTVEQPVTARRCLAIFRSRPITQDVTIQVPAFVAA